MDKTVGKSIYTVYKSDILTVNLLHDGLEDLASTLGGYRYANIGGKLPAA